VGNPDGRGTADRATHGGCSVSPVCSCPLGRIIVSAATIICGLVSARPPCAGARISMVRHQPPNSWLMPRRTVTGKPRPLAGLHATPLVARSSSTDRYRRGISHLCRAILAPGDVVVMDNLGAQKIARIAQPIAAAEPGVLYHPIYSLGLQHDRRGTLAFLQSVSKRLASTGWPRQQPRRIDGSHHSSLDRTSVHRPTPTFSRH